MAGVSIKDLTKLDLRINRDDLAGLSIQDLTDVETLGFEKTNRVIKRVDQSGHKQCNNSNTKKKK